MRPVYRPRLTCVAIVITCDALLLALCALAWHFVM